MEITASTITGNQADAGGGYVGWPGPIPQRHDLVNTIPTATATLRIIDLGYNISDDGSLRTSAVPALTTPIRCWKPLANNGGPTDTFALETSPSDEPGDRPDSGRRLHRSVLRRPLGTDQRLFTRPDPGNPNSCDSGAYEAGALMPYCAEQRAGADSAFEHCKYGPGQHRHLPSSTMAIRLAIWVWAAMKTRSITASVVALFQGTCAGLPANGLIINLDPFVVHTVNHEQYGTLFQSRSTGWRLVSARMVALPTPAGACSAFTLNLEVAGLNTTRVARSGRRQSVCAGIN